MQRWSGIAASLYNTHRYYSQFAGLMQKAISDGLADLEKQLEVRTHLPLVLTCYHHNNSTCAFKQRLLLLTWNTSRPPCFDPYP